jgi:archaeosine-15-forming tRNA-guanine transglycosylase
MTGEIGEDDIARWVAAVQEQQRRNDATVLVDRDEHIEALGHATISARRLRGTVYYANAHARINELLDELVGL